MGLIYRHRNYLGIRAEDLESYIQSNSVLWLDSTDLSLGDVSSWVSKSANTSYTAIAQAGQEPEKIASGVDFAGGESMKVANFDLSGTQEAEVFIVAEYKDRSISGGLKFFFEHTANVNNNAGGFALWTPASFDPLADINFVQKVQVGGLSDGLVESDFVTAGDPVRNGVLNAQINPNLLNTATFNGTFPFAQGSGTSPTGYQGNLLNDDLFIGSRGDTSFFLDNIIFELLIFPSLQLSKRNEIIDYLKSKYSIA